MSSQDAKKTPLFNKHVSLGARMADFSGWSMPIQYSGILQEHSSVRTGVGVFDISHMGEFFVTGAGAAPFLDRMLTNRASALLPGRCHYTLMLNENGGVIDDLIACRLSANEFFLVVNASKIEEDAAWMAKWLPDDDSVQFIDRSPDFAAIAIQGPQSPEIFHRLLGAKMPGRNALLRIGDGASSLLAGITGYTGEAGFELFVPAERGVEFFDAAIALGATPCGLGARDSLRLEMCFPLNGAELSPQRTPLEAGLGLFVDLGKADFIGREALLAQKQNGIPSLLCAIQMDGTSPPPRPHYPVFHEGLLVSETTSGTLSPSTGTGIAMAYLPPACGIPDTPLAIEIRGRQFPARVVKRPFYKK